MTYPTDPAHPADPPHGTGAGAGDDLALLTGPEVPALLEAALTGGLGGVAGAQSAALRARVDRVQHRAGAGVSVGYEVTYPAADGSVAGTDYLVASTVELAAAGPKVATLDDGQRRVHVWRHPDDPALPGLSAACDATRVGQWWQEVLAGADVLPEPVGLQFLAYRPLRRAVLRATSGERTTYLKVLTRRRHEGLVRRHRMLADHGSPAPALLATPAEGVSMLEQAAGVPLAQVLADAREDPRGLPDPGAMVAALDALPGPAVSLPLRQSWADRLEFHAGSAAAALPQQAVRVRELARRVAVLLARSDAGPVVPTHGDFYEANVFMAGGRVSSLIDVDSLGPGHRVDDLACMLAHLSVLADLSPRVYPHVPEVVTGWLSAFDDEADPVALRARAAAVVLSLVPGADAEQGLARLAVGERWCAQADEALGAGRSLG